MDKNKGNGSNDNMDVASILLDVLGIIINLENLRLNEEQSNGIMQELSEKQDKMLEQIIEQNERIIKLLEKKDGQNR